MSADFSESQIVYEDNHLIIVNKLPSQIVQGDKTGDLCMADLIKDYLKQKYDKPGNVFCGVVHRLDRPVSGLVIFAKTSKALSRLNEQIKRHEIRKTYWAVVKNAPPKSEDTLTDYLLRNEKQNKSYVVKAGTSGAKEAILHYRTLAQSSGGYYLLEVDLQTGRHHQIRAQLAGMGCPIKGDLKYGFPRSNSDASISLHARRVEFVHPVRKEPMSFVADVPQDSIFEIFG